MPVLNAGPDCVMPPAPELLDRIMHAKAMLDAGEKVPARATRDSVDLVSLTKILARPPQTRAETFTAPVREQAPIVGTRRALVLLVDFADSAAAETQAHFNELLFSVAPTPRGACATSTRRPRMDSSTSSVSLPALAGRPQGGSARREQEVLHERQLRLRQLPEERPAARRGRHRPRRPGRRLRRLQRRHRRRRGTGAHLRRIGCGASGNIGDIWSHKWRISTQTRDGKTISRYFMAPEDGRVGVMAHELGHLLLGLPDLYDTDYSSRAPAVGT